MARSLSMIRCSPTRQRSLPSNNTSNYPIIMDQVFRLADGRQLSYSVSAATDGIPLIFFHGTPGSKAVLPAFEAQCERRGVKLITVNRAGYAGSTRHRGRHVVDVVDDMRQLTQHLNISTCLVAGWSGGGRPRRFSCRSFNSFTDFELVRPACSCVRSAIAGLSGRAFHRQRRAL